MYLGAATGFVGGLGSQGISIADHQQSGVNWLGVGIDTGLGGAENGAGGWIGKSSENETLGNAMSGFAGINQGVLCGAMGASNGWSQRVGC